MALKIKHEIEEPFNITVDCKVSVDSKGTFATTIPKEFADILIKHGFNLFPNRLKNPGYFSDITFDGLSKQIKDIIDELCSEELFNEQDVIRFSIETSCAYSITKEGSLVSNNAYKDSLGWKEGTVKPACNSSGPYGFWIYALPYCKKTFRFKNGKKRVEYELLGCNDHSPDINDDIQWLRNVVHNKPRGKLQEVPCTAENLKLFRGFFEGLFAMNERIKPFLNPEGIKKLASKSIPLLGSEVDYEEVS